MLNDSVNNQELMNTYSNEFDSKKIVSPLLNNYETNLTYSSCNSNQWATWKVFDRNENTQSYLSEIYVYGVEVLD